MTGTPQTGAYTSAPPRPTPRMPSLIHDPRRLPGGLVRISVLLLSLAATSSTAAAQPDERSAQVDSLFMPYDRTGTPGCAVSVVRDGEVVHTHGYGMASLEHGVPITTRTAFDVASMSKQFTALAAALLAEDGRLDLDADVLTYLPEMPDYGEPITVRHLVHNASGLRDLLSLWYFSGRDWEDTIPHAFLLDLIARQTGLNHRPGERVSYTNTGYFLLALVVESAADAPFAEVVRERITEPLGLRDTRVVADLGTVVPNAADSYRLGDDGDLDRVHLKFRVPGPASMVSTAEDFARWMLHYDRPTLGRDPDALLATVTSGMPLADGEASSYAYGLMPGTYGGLPIVNHGGFMGGFNSRMILFPDQRFGATVLCNQAEHSTFRLARQVATIYLGDEMPDPPAPFGPSGVAVPDVTPTYAPDVLAEYAGDYVSEELQATHRVRVQDSTLTVGVGIHPVHTLHRDPDDPDTFRDPASQVGWRFTRDARGDVDGLEAFTFSGRIVALPFRRRGAAD